MAEFDAQSIAHLVARARAQWAPYDVEPDPATGGREPMQVQHDPRMEAYDHDVMALASMLDNAMNGWCPAHAHPDPDSCEWCRWDAVRAVLDELPSEQERRATLLAGMSEEPF